MVPRSFLLISMNSLCLLFLGEALGAIGDPEVLDILKQYSTDPVVEVTRPGPPSPCPRLDQPQTRVCLQW